MMPYSNVSHYSFFVRPPDIVVGGLIFYQEFFFLSFFLFSFFLFFPFFLSSFFAVWSPSSLNGTKRKLVACYEVSAIWKSMSKIWGIPSPYKLGARNHHFGRLRNLMASLKAYIFGMKQDIDNRASALTTTRGLLHHLKTTWTLVHKRLQTRPPFYPPSLNFAFYFMARLRRRRSGNGTQPHFANGRRYVVLTSTVEKLGSSLPKK